MGLNCRGATHVVRVALLYGTIAVSQAAEIPPVASYGSVASPSGAQGAATDCKDGRLSVRATNRSLESLLNDVSRSCKIGITREDGAGNQAVTIQFDGLSPDEGLRRILKGFDAFFYYDAGAVLPGGQPPLKAVWVYPKGRGRAIRPVPPEDWASTQELRERLQNDDPEVRAAAVAALVSRDGERARSAILQSLDDSDARVRTRAMFSALDEGVEIPASRLEDLATRDSSTDVRVLSLQALAAGPEGQRVAESLLDDSDPYVRRAAGEILQRLDAQRRRREGTPVQRAHQH